MTDRFLQLRAALRGEFQYEVDAARGHVENALGLAMAEVAEELKGKLRTDVERSGLANANRLKTAAWQSRLYGVGKSLEPAAWIYSKLPVIVQAFENGVTVRAKGGGGLLIPNPDVWGGRARFKRGTGTMGGLWAIATARFGELAVVRRPGKATLVVAQVRQGTGVRGGFRRASASALKRAGEGKASGLATVVVFVIAKEAKLPRLLKGATIRARASRDVPDRLQTLFHKYFTAYDAGSPRQITNQSRPSAPRSSGFGDGPATW